MGTVRNDAIDREAFQRKCAFDLDEIQWNNQLEEFLKTYAGPILLSKDQALEVIEFGVVGGEKIAVDNFIDHSLFLGDLDNWLPRFKCTDASTLQEKLDWIDMDAPKLFVNIFLNMDTRDVSDSESRDVIKMMAGKDVVWVFCSEPLLHYILDGYATVDLTTQQMKTSTCNPITFEEYLELI